MIKNVIFDIGNVLLNYDPYSDLLRLGYDRKQAERLMKAIFEDPVWLEIDRGTYTRAEALDLFAAANPDLAEDARWVFDDAWYGRVLTPKDGTAKDGAASEFRRPMDDSVSFFKRLKAEGYQLYLLSNFSKEGFEKIWQWYDFLHEAEGMIISSHVGLVKPEPAIYQSLLDRYGLNAEECVFFDDTRRNAEAAEKMGIHGIWFHDAEQAEREFRELTGLRHDKSVGHDALGAPNIPKG